MIITKTHINDLIIIEPKVFRDNRGYFLESYSKTNFDQNGIKINFIQDNEAKSSYGVLRGLHFQNPPYSQTKLIRVIKGSVLDVVVDLRKSSKTFGLSFSIELNDENKMQLLVPKGFAHGYIVMSQDTILSYKVDEIYRPDLENGILWNDNDLKIDWKISESEIILSEKDKKLSNFADLNSPFE